MPSNLLSGSSTQILKRTLVFTNSKKYKSEPVNYDNTRTWMWSFSCEQSLYALYYARGVLASIIVFWLQLEWNHCETSMIASSWQSFPCMVQCAEKKQIGGNGKKSRGSPTKSGIPVPDQFRPRLPRPRPIFPSPIHTSARHRVFLAHCHRGGLGEFR